MTSAKARRSWSHNDKKRNLTIAMLTPQSLWSIVAKVNEDRLFEYGLGDKIVYTVPAERGAVVFRFLSFDVEG